MSGKKVNITQCGMYWYAILIGMTQLIWLAAISGIHVVVLVWATLAPVSYTHLTLPTILLV